MPAADDVWRASPKNGPAASNPSTSVSKPAGLEAHEGTTSSTAGPRHAAGLPVSCERRLPAGESSAQDFGHLSDDPNCAGAGQSELRFGGGIAGTACARRARLEKSVGSHLD